MHTLPFALAGALLVSAASAASAQASPDSVHVRWFPAEPHQGSLVQLAVRLPSARQTRDVATATVEGHLAGQPLHFEASADGTYRALGAIPVGSKATIPLMLEVHYADGDVQEPFVRIPVAVTEFAVERLRVAPQFVQPPDSALRVRIAAERARSAAVVRRTHDTPRMWTGAFVVPVGGRVTSSFGRGREFNGRVQSRHYGTDLDGNTGTPVLASGRGIVALTDDTYYGGRVVYLDHGRGLVSGYMHLSEILVAKGDTVEQGQVIGKVGATGRVTGPHLHWLVRYGSVLVDPMSLFDVEPTAFDGPGR